MTKETDKGFGTTSEEGEIDNNMDYKAPPPYNPMSDFSDQMEDQIEGMESGYVKDFSKEYMNELNPSAPELPEITEDYSSKKSSIKSTVFSFFTIVASCLLEEDLDHDDVDFAVDTADIFLPSFEKNGLSVACNDLFDLFSLPESKGHSSFITSFCQESFSFSQSQGQSSFSYSFTYVFQSRVENIEKDMKKSPEKESSFESELINELDLEGVKDLGGIKMESVDMSSGKGFAPDVTPSAPPEHQIEVKEGDQHTR